VERLAAAVEAAMNEGGTWDERLAAGLAAGLELLAADPPLAHRLFVETPAVAPAVRLERERSLRRLAEALGPPVDPRGGDVVPEETLRLLAGGLVSHISGRVLAGEAERLTGDRDLLLGYLLAPTVGADARVATG
jgi:hypothetical protein